MPCAGTSRQTDGQVVATDRGVGAAELTIVDNPNDDLIQDGNHHTKAGHQLLAAQFHSAVRHKLPVLLPESGMVVPVHWSARRQGHLLGCTLKAASSSHSAMRIYA